VYLNVLETSYSNLHIDRWLLDTETPSVRVEEYYLMLLTPGRLMRDFRLCGFVDPTNELPVCGYMRG
jgi:hypothetical protein